MRHVSAKANSNISMGQSKMRAANKIMRLERDEKKRKAREARANYRRMIGLPVT